MGDGDIRSKLISMNILSLPIKKPVPNLLA